MSRYACLATLVLLASCVGGRGSSQAAGPGALSASDGFEDVPAAVCIGDECNGGLFDGVAMPATDVASDFSPEFACVLSERRPSSSPNPCPPEQGDPLLAWVLPGDWPSSSAPPACFLYDPPLDNLSDHKPEPFGVATAALASPPCGIATETGVTTCNSYDVRVGVVHNRLLNVGTEAWADAYYDAPEQSGCRWGDSITVDWRLDVTKITPVARGIQIDNDQENGYISTSYYIEAYDCGTSSYCGTGSPSQETTSPCNGGGTFIDDHSITSGETSDLGMSAVGIWPLGGCNRLEIPRPSCATGTNYGCIRWYWFHIRTTNDNRWGYDRTADDYGCLRVRWCGGWGCP